MKVVKRDGSIEKLNIRKISDSISWACEGLDVSPSDIEVNLKLHLFDGIKTEDIHQKVIKTIVDMVSARTPDYDKVAARLLMSDIYKNVYKGHEPIRFLDVLSKFTYYKYYKKSLMVDYSIEEILMLEKAIEYENNFNFSYIGLKYLKDKYMIKGVIEDPQVMFMTIAMDMFLDIKPKTLRLQYVIEMYKALSNFKVSLPTPMMKALRTTNTNYASCVALNIGDSISSWTTGFKAVVKHTVANAGIGVDVSSISSIGDKVKKGQITHGGKIPLLKALDALIQTSTQNGRRGQAVAYINFFDPEIESILALKSPRTDVAKRINDLKYAIKFNQLFYDRVLEDGYITLLSVRKYPELQKAFDSNDYGKFKRVYEGIEASTQEEHRTIKALDLLTMFLTERFENGVYYVFNVDEANKRTPYTEPITQSNICMEFISPTKPITEISEESKEPNVGICILANINQANVDITELPSITRLLVYGLNEIMHRQEQPTAGGQAFVDAYASLGIGFANHAYWVAKHGWKYGDKEALETLDEWMEYFQYGLVNASIEYAKEFDKSCKLANKTKIISEGKVPYPIERSRLPWDKLITKAKKFGIANAALSMIPPSETSSVISNSTSGIEPIRDIVTVKGSKKDPIVQFAPEGLRLADKYDYAFSRKDITRDFLKHVAVVQDWIDQGISANTFYNPELYEDGKVPIVDLMEDMFLAKRLGIKTLYYNNTYVKDNMTEQVSCSSGGCEV